MDQQAPPRRWVPATLRARFGGGVWGYDDFRRLWAAQTVSVFGTLISRTAIPYTAILVLDASPLQIAALGVSELAPAFLLGLLAGAWVDRLPRKPIMVAADLARALLLLLVPLLAWRDLLGIGTLLAVSAGISVFSVFFDVANRSVLPAVLPADQVLEGNSRLSASASAAEFAAFSAGGWLVHLLTAPGAVLIDAATFLWSAATLRGLHLQEAFTPPEERLPLRREIGDGLSLVWRNRSLRAIAGFTATCHLAFSLFGAVFLIYLTREVGFDPGVLGLIFAVGGLTSIGGAMIAERVTGALGLRASLFVLAAILAVGQGSIVLITSVSAVAIAILVVQQFLVDVPYTILQIQHATLRQTSAPAAWQGRLNATFEVLTFGGMLIGTLTGGMVGEWIGLRPALALAGLVVAGATLWGRILPARVPALAEADAAV